MPTSRRPLAALALFLTAAALIAQGCEPSKPSKPADLSSRTIQITATIGMIAEPLRQIAGDRAEVTTLIGQGIDPHLYQPTSADLRILRQSDIIFYNGILLEGKLTQALESTTRRGQPAFPVAEDLIASPDFAIPDEHDTTATDPHVWMDVRAWGQALEIATTHLAGQDPTHAQLYQERLSLYLESLATLDDYARETIASIPENNRVLVTAHDAFRYLGRAYGLEVRGIQGLSTDSEPGLRDLEELVDYLVEQKIPAVFLESSVPEHHVRALVEGAEARGHQLAIGGLLFSDSMGPEGTYTGSYIGMIDHNVTTIARALGGSPPERGMQGKLPPPQD